MSDSCCNIENEKESKEGFGELLKLTVAGFIGGLGLGVLLDLLGFQKNPIGQWIVRTISGEGESIFEGIYSLKQRIKKAEGSMAEAYGWGKFLGISVPWIIDWLSRLAKIDIYGVEGFYIPYFYALSDQIGGNISGFVFLYRREKSLTKALNEYFHHPVMITSLSIILLVPIGLLTVRLLGFSPTTQTYTALETMVADLCWLPPFIGWLKDRKSKKEKV
jgi:hypothetical protein